MLKGFTVSALIGVVSLKIVVDAVRGPDNLVSRAMIEACGLDDTNGLVSIAASCFEERFSR